MNYKNNAAAIDRVFGGSDQLTIVSDGYQKGTVLAAVNGQWLAADLDRGTLKMVDRIAVVSLESGADPDDGLNQEMLACDLDCEEWIIDLADLKEMQSIYGDRLKVIWDREAS